MSMQDAVETVFARLAAGELDAPPAVVQDGWEVRLPSGRTVARSTLQGQAAPLVRLGLDAVPHLLPRVMDDAPAPRYVAMYALEQITGLPSPVPYFDPPGERADRSHAVDAWRRWYEARG